MTRKVVNVGALAVLIRTLPELTEELHMLALVGELDTERMPMLAGLVRTWRDSSAMARLAVRQYLVGRSPDTAALLDELSSLAASLPRDF